MVIFIAKDVDIYSETLDSAISRGYRTCLIASSFQSILRSLRVWFAASTQPFHDVIFSFHGIEKEDEIIIKVEDNGKGISDKEKDKIFERGYKKGESRGSRLGMYLVKEIAETYDGNVEVKDSKLGGARFDIYLQKT